ncbi:MAG: Yip1 family protein [Candidatus Saccharicenans sp.]
MDKIKKIFKILYSPSEVFRSIKEKADVGSPFIIISVALSIVTLIMFFLLNDLINKNPEPWAIAASGTRIIIFFGLIISIIGLGLSWLFRSALLYLLSQLFDGKGNFENILSLVAYTSFITFQKNIFDLLLIILRRPERIYNLADFKFKYGLDIFFSSAGLNHYLYLFLGKINLFSIWFLISQIIGISIICDLIR